MDQGCRSKRFDFHPFAVNPDDDFGPAKFLVAAEEVQLCLTARESTEAEANEAAFAIQAALHKFCFAEAVLEDDLV